jgi:hypothetical protein
MTELLRAKYTKDIGTYKTVTPIGKTFSDLAEAGFTSTTEPVDWLKNYPLKQGKDADDLIPTGHLTPRQAIKMLYDAVWLIEQADKNPKFFADKLPEMCEKVYKRKQWRKQFMEACKRVCCRLAKGKGAGANCVAEDVFVHIILQNVFDLGWNRIAEKIKEIPSSSSDRDWTKANRHISSDEVGMLWRGADAVSSAQTKAAKTGKKSVSGDKALDCLLWFKGYDSEAEHLLDHVIQ